MATRSTNKKTPKTLRPVGNSYNFDLALHCIREVVGPVPALATASGAKLKWLLTRDSGKLVWALCKGKRQLVATYQYHGAGRGATVTIERGRRRTKTFPEMCEALAYIQHQF